MEILLGLFDGARYLAAQLNSFARQTHPNWSLSIRDDGSRDHGPQIARAFAEAMPGHDIRITGGTHRGFARNFLTLLECVDPRAQEAAFSDQDDVWLPGKLEHALARR